MQLTHATTKRCNMRLGVITIISIIGSATRSEHVTIHIVHDLRISPELLKT